MGKLKKKLKKKVNPEKSNKMIIAVAVGLVLLMVVLYIFFAGGSGPVDKKDKKAVMEHALKYLKDGKGVAQVKIIPEQNKAIIIYDESIEHMDFPSVARFASLKLSNNLPGEEVSIALVAKRDKEQKETFEAFSKDGIVLRMLQK